MKQKPSVLSVAKFLLTETNVTFRQKRENIKYESNCFEIEVSWCIALTRAFFLSRIARQG